MSTSLPWNVPHKCTASVKPLLGLLCGFVVVSEVCLDSSNGGAPTARISRSREHGLCRDEFSMLCKNTVRSTTAHDSATQVLTESHVLRPPQLARAPAHQSATLHQPSTCSPTLPVTPAACRPLRLASAVHLAGPGRRQWRQSPVKSSMATHHGRSRGSLGSTSLRASLRAPLPLTELL